jgi:tetratricopeptide (TPR) repeat protein
MMYRVRPAVVTALLLLVLSMMATAGQAQFPDKFTNLKVLDKDISKQELLGTMKHFAQALDVRCEFCHVQKGEGENEEMDFASDQKPEKDVARLMMRMTHTINADWVSKVGDQDDEGEGEHEAEHHHMHVTVQCMTCHRGQEQPVMLEDVLAEAKEDGGMKALTAKYDELRAKYYGRATYDFGPMVLDEMAEDAVRDGDLENAKALVELNIKNNPDSAAAYMMLGQVEIRAGNKDAAIAAMKKALEIEPDNQWAKRMLGRMEKME